MRNADDLPDLPDLPDLRRIELLYLRQLQGAPSGDSPGAAFLGGAEVVRLPAPQLLGNVARLGAGPAPLRIEAMRAENGAENGAENVGEARSPNDQALPSDSLPLTAALARHPRLLLRGGPPAAHAICRALTRACAEIGWAYTALSWPFQPAPVWVKLDDGADDPAWATLLRAAVAAQLATLPIFALDHTPAPDVCAAALLATWARQGRLLLLIELGELGELGGRGGAGAWWRRGAQWLAGQERAGRVVLAAGDSPLPYSLARWFTPFTVRRAAGSAAGSAASVPAPGLSADLTSGNPDARLAAIVQCVAASSAPPAQPAAPPPAPPEPVLVQSLRDMWHEVRAAAAIALGLAGSAAAIPPLTMAMGDPAAGVRAAAASAIGQIAAAQATAAGYRALAAALEAYYADVRAAAARALGALVAAPTPLPVRPPARSLDPLLLDPLLPARLAALLADRSGEVQSAAIAALREVGEPAIPALAAALASTCASVRAGAAQALGGPGRPAALPLLLAARRDPDASVRAAVAQALGQAISQSPAQVLPALDELAADVDAGVRAAAAAAFSVLGSVHQAHPPTAARGDSEADLLAGACARRLASLLRDRTPAVRAAAVIGLVALGGAAAPALLETLSAPDPAMRWLAIHTLGAIGGGSVDGGGVEGGTARAAVHAALSAALDDPYSAVRWLAADTLGQLGLHGSALQSARRDRNPIVRAAAHAAFAAAPSAAPAGGRQTAEDTRRSLPLPASPPG